MTLAGLCAAVVFLSLHEQGGHSHKMLSSDVPVVFSSTAKKVVRHLFIIFGLGGGQSSSGLLWCSLASACRLMPDAPARRCGLHANLCDDDDGDVWRVYSPAASCGE